MSRYSFYSSRPDAWSHPRPYRDASLRYMAHGRVLPAEQPNWISRLLGLS